MLKRIRLGKKQRHYLGSRLITVDGLIDAQLSAAKKEFIEIVKGAELSEEQIKNFIIEHGWILDDRHTELMIETIKYAFEACRQAILKEVE